MMGRLAGPAVVALLALSAGYAGAASAQSTTVGVPREPLTDYAARYAAAVAALQAGDCAALARHNPARTLGEIPCNAESRHYYRDFRVLGHQRFATGAVIDRAARDRRTGQRVVATDVLALGPDRRYHLLGGAIYGYGAGIHQVGTRPSPRVLTLAARTASVYLGSLRARNCDVFFHTGFTGRLSKPAACREAFQGTGQRLNASRLRRQLDAGPAGRPVRIGGTRDIQFYRLSTQSGHGWTLIVDRNVPPPGGVGGGSFLVTQQDVL